MSTRVRKHLTMLQLLAKAKPPLVKTIIRAADKDLVHCLCECALNVIKGNVPLSPAQIRKLTPYKTGLREVVKKRVALKKKKQVLQRGGFLGTLLGTLTPLLIEGISTAVKRRQQQKRHRRQRQK